MRKPVNIMSGFFATDINGCSDTLVKSYTVNRLPFVHIINDIDTVCLGQTDNLIAFHSDSLTWSPAAGSISCVTCDTTVVTPPSTMKFFATATSKFNCVSTDSMLVKVYGPFTAAAPVSDYYMCEHESVQLDISPASYKICMASFLSLLRTISSLLFIIASKNSFLSLSVI